MSGANTPVAARPRVLLADDHTVVSEGVRALLARDFVMVGVARHGRELLALAAELRPDIIVADIAMPVMNGLEAIERLQAEYASPVIVLSAHETPAYVRAAFRAGAKGYVLKAQAEQLPEAIRAVLSGRMHFPADWEEREAGQPDLLSPREREVLAWVAEGKAAKEIAALLGVSVRTVEFHKYSIMNKLELRTTAELIRYALGDGRPPSL